MGPYFTKVGSLLGPYFKAWRSLIVWVTVVVVFGDKDENVEVTLTEKSSHEILHQKARKMFTREEMRVHLRRSTSMKN